MTTAAIFRPKNLVSPKKGETHDELEVVLQVLAGGGELLRGGVLEVPQLVLHPVVELLRVPLPLQVELAADGGVL